MEPVTMDTTDLSGWQFILFFIVAIIVILAVSAAFWYVKARVITKAAKSGGAGNRTITVQHADN